MKKSERNSNFELMRIVSILLIIMYHIIYHGNVIQLCTTQTLKYVFKIIEVATLVHVSSFVLLTGYYQSTSQFKQSKLWKINNACWFYRIVIVILFTFMNIISLDKLSLFKNFFPFEIYHYWFIETYILLYLISPLLNASIKSMSKKTYKRIILVLFIIFSVLPWITNFQTFKNNGYTLYHFIYLYLIGGYLRKYPIINSYFFRGKSNLFKRFILLSIILICVILNYLIYYLSFKYTANNLLINDIINNIQTNLLFYSNPFVVIQSVAYFLLFSTFKFKNKIINVISSLTIGIYLIHDNNYVRDNIYTWLNINNTPIVSFTNIIWILISTFIIFLICAIIEFIRQKIFLFIYNRKISTMIRKKYYALFNKLNI